MGVYTCEIGADFTNMLISKRVDLVLHGHEHLYQRTHQLGTAPGCSALTPDAYVGACVADGDNDRFQGRGTTFVTAGTGGITCECDVNPSDAEAPGLCVVVLGLTPTPTWGSLDVRVESDQLIGSFLRGSAGVSATPSRYARTPHRPNTPPGGSDRDAQLHGFDVFVRRVGR